MGVWQSYRLRLQRKRWRIRAFHRRRDLSVVADRTHLIRADDILIFCTQRNERIRLPFFLDYYRKMGVNHFLIVDNDSTDGALDYLVGQPDVSVWHSKASYKRARYGVDWLNWLQMRHAHGHWSLVVDPDEFLVYPFCDTRPLRALTDWLDASSIKSFSAMLLDPTFPKWHAVGRQDRQLSLIDQAFWGLDGACMDPNARMRAGRSANPHHFGPASPFFSAVDRPVLPLSFSCCQDRGHAHIGGARNR